MIATIGLPGSNTFEFVRGPSRAAADVWRAERAHEVAALARDAEIRAVWETGRGNVDHRAKFVDLAFRLAA